MIVSFGPPSESLLANNLPLVIVSSFTDSPDTKEVKALVDGLWVTLWEGNSYDNIGQWTDADVVGRLIEIL